MDGVRRHDPLFVEGMPEPEGRMAAARRMKLVGPGFFATMGRCLVAGRDFTWDDVHSRRPVGIVSANLARELFGSAPAALGRRMRPAPRGPWREIVGVVGDEHDDGPTRPATPLVVLAVPAGGLRSRTGHRATDAGLRRADGSIG